MRKIMSLFIAIILIVSLSACGTKSPEPLPEEPEAPQIDQSYVDAVKYFQGTLKDPASLRIYGDICGVISNQIPGYSLSICYSAKNAFGGYVGRKQADIIAGTDGSFLVRYENDDDYINILMIYETALAGNLPDGWTAETFIVSGADMAQIIGCEYYD